MDKRGIIAVLNEIGMLLELKGENFFKSKAYYEAARALELLDDDPETLVAEDRLKDIKGFGSALVRKISELVTTGRLEYYEELKSTVPPGLVKMLSVYGLGSKKIKTIYEILGIDTVEGLKAAAEEGRLADLPGFGAKSQSRILESIANMERYSGQYYYYQAIQYAGRIIGDILESGLVLQCSEAGSLRRKKETVKDIDIVASSVDIAGLMDVFTAGPLVASVMNKGETKSSVTLVNGINADLRAVNDIEYPFALHHFTGSREHNTAMRHMAKQSGYKMNEYGIFAEDGKSCDCASEKEIFAHFGMQYIPPELRENNGEIEAALKGEIPVLVENSDIKGVIHFHSDFSDGLNTVEQVARVCMEKGYGYLGITDHSISAYYANGLKKDDIRRQHDEIDRLNAKYPSFRIFKGIELDILANGNVDYEGYDEILGSFDFTIASVHSSFRMDEARMTDRIIKAMRNRYVDILGHPTGRLLLDREAYAIDYDRIFAEAAESGVHIEINANPHRLDLDWRYCRAARDRGCRFVICPDGHESEGIYDIQYGVNVARKGWLTKKDIVNALDAEGFLRSLRNCR